MWYTAAMKKPSDEIKILYDELVNDISHEAPIVASQMFGMPTVKLNGKAVFGLFEENMVFKLPETEWPKL